MSKPTRRHHYVPQFYLREFASDGQVHCVRLENGARFNQSVSRAAMETDLYTLASHPDGPDVFEKAIASSIETDASVALKQMMHHGVRSISFEQRVSISQFIALQAARGPEMSRTIAAIEGMAVRLEVGYGGRENVAKWVKSRLRTNITEEAAQALWDSVNKPADTKRKTAPEIHVHNMVHLLEQLWPYIMGRPWMLIRFTQRSLFTSDAPIGLVPSEEDLENPFGGVGFATAAGITVPLSRKMGLLLGDPMNIADLVDFEFVASGKADYNIKGTAAFAHLFNDHTAGSASEWLFCHPDDAHLLPDPLPTQKLVSIQMHGLPETFEERSPFARD